MIKQENHFFSILPHNLCIYTKQGMYLNITMEWLKNTYTSTPFLGGVRLGGQGMPNIMHIPFYFKPRGLKKNSIPNMM